VVTRSRLRGIFPSVRTTTRGALRVSSEAHNQKQYPTTVEAIQTLLNASTSTPARAYEATLTSKPTSIKSLRCWRGRLPRFPLGAYHIDQSYHKASHTIPPKQGEKTPPSNKQGRISWRFTGMDITRHNIDGITRSKPGRGEIFEKYRIIKEERAAKPCHAMPSTAAAAVEVSGFSPAERKRMQVTTVQCPIPCPAGW